MNFERHRDPKESLQIGKVWKAKKVYCIHLRIRDKNIVDNRPFRERRFSRSPQTLASKPIKGEDCHIILGLIHDRKSLWEFIFQMFPFYMEDLKTDKVQAGFHVLLEPEGSKGYPTLSRSGCFGQDLFYDGKIYSIPEISKCT